MGVDVLLVSQSGGHLLELVGLRGAWEPFSRVWVTSDAAGSRCLLRRERVVFANSVVPRSVPNLLRDLLLAWQVVRRERPMAVVTTGGAVAVPFAWIGRLLGARVVYVECGGRVDRASLACRLIAPVADRVYVQWPELVGAVAGARYAGRIRLTPDVLPPASEPLPELGTLVSVGTCPYPFDRLVRVVDRLPGPNIVAQTGFTRMRLARAQNADFLSFAELVASMRQARTVITHAGIGSVLLAHACGKRPIVVPRRPDLGENVDDHQIAFARRLAEAGLITLVEDPELLPALLERDGDCTLARTGEGDGRLAGELRKYLTACPPRRARAGGRGGHAGRRWPRSRV